MVSLIHAPQHSPAEDDAVALPSPREAHRLSCDLSRHPTCRPSPCHTFLQLAGPAAVEAIIGPPPYPLPLHLRLTALVKALVPAGVKPPLPVDWPQGITLDAAQADAAVNARAWKISPRCYVPGDWLLVLFQQSYSKHLQNRDAYVCA